MADVLEAAVNARDGSASESARDEIATRMDFAVELAKWLFPSFGRLPTYRDEIARLRAWQ